MTEHMQALARVIAEDRTSPEWAVVSNGILYGSGLPADDASDNLGLFLARLDSYPSGLDCRRLLDPSRLTWLTPIARPSKIVCLGLNYVQHAREGGNTVPEFPTLFMRGITSLTAHCENIMLPQQSTNLDFEAELAVIIGSRARFLDHSNALKAVAGYSCFNDATLRDYQRKTTQWMIGKNFDSTGGFGPYLIPAKRLPPGAINLHIESRLNGKIVQSDNTSNMIVSVAQALVAITEVMTLNPGDVIAMGTPAGVGYARKPSLWMKKGDEITVTIENIGTLINKVD